MAILALLIWFCCKRKKNDDKDFDFRDDDAWDPAVGTAAVMSQKGSSGTLHRKSRYDSVGGGSPGRGSGYGTALAAGGAAAVVGGAAASSREDRRRRNRPSDQQDSYYSSVPQVDRYGAATPGTEANNGWDQGSYGLHDSGNSYGDNMSEYGGNVAAPSVAASAGMAGVGAMGGRRQSPLQQQAMRQSYHQRQLSGGDQYGVQSYASQ